MVWFLVTGIVLHSHQQHHRSFSLHNQAEKVKTSTKEKKAEDEALNIKDYPSCKAKQRIVF